MADIGRRESRASGSPARARSSDGKDALEDSLDELSRIADDLLDGLSPGAETAAAEGVPAPALADQGLAAVAGDAAPSTLEIEDLQSALDAQEMTEAREVGMKETLEEIDQLDGVVLSVGSRVDPIEVRTETGSDIDAALDALLGGAEAGPARAAADAPEPAACVELSDEDFVELPPGEVVIVPTGDAGPASPAGDSGDRLGEAPFETVPPERSSPPRHRAPGADPDRPGQRHVAPPSRDLLTLGVSAAAGTGTWAAMDADARAVPAATAARPSRAWLFLGTILIVAVAGASWMLISRITSVRPTSAELSVPRAVQEHRADPRPTVPAPPVESPSPAGATARSVPPTGAGISSAPVERPGSAGARSARPSATDAEKTTRPPTPAPLAAAAAPDPLPTPRAADATQLQARAADAAREVQVPAQPPSAPSTAEAGAPIEPVAAPDAAAARRTAASSEPEVGEDRSADASRGDSRASLQAIHRAPAGAGVPLHAPRFEPPEAETRIEPLYTPLARARGDRGTVVLSVLVDENGRVARALVDRGIAGSDLEAAAIDAVLRWTFRPATEAGHPIRAWVTVSFAFEP